MRVESNQTSINKLRVTSNDRDSMHVRLELGRIFSGADLHPTNLPANAIVCVNQFRTGPPRGSRHQMGHGWEQNVRLSLSDIVSRAERPILGLSSGAPNAVIFADMAELLACLARDWSSGRLITNWWWRVLLREDKSLWAIWRRHAEYLPAALQHLVRQKAAVRVLNGFANEELVDLGQIVVERFALHRLKASFLVPLIVSVLPQAAKSHEPTGSDAPLGWSIPQETHSRVIAPWRVSIPQVEFDQLEGEQERFLGLCLMLQREPSRVRSEGFARELKVWQQEVRDSVRTARREADPGKRKTGFREAVPPAASDTITDRSKTTDRNNSPGLRELSQPTEAEFAQVDNQHTAAIVTNDRKSGSSRPASRDQTEATSDHTQLSSETDNSPAVSALEVSALPLEVNIERASSPSQTPPPLTSNTAEEIPILNTKSLLPTEELPHTTEVESVEPVLEEAQLDPAIVVNTKLGGLFYLINLALYLELYGDFTTPDSPGIQLNLWDFITLVGAELSEHEFPQDPIWSLLETLAGRDDKTLPGSDFASPADWRMSATWLNAFPAKEVWRWTTNKARLRLMHAGGFLVLDIPRDSRNALTQIQAEAEVYWGSYDSLEFASASRFAETSTSRKREELDPAHLWLDRLLPYLRARLRQSFGASYDGEPGKALCRRAATVRVTQTHVDVFFDLADLPIEIRLSGLDRDPGWVPAGGRFIAFHYE
ncbi:MAG TPA: hypothetical protein VJU86_21240 [Pyrinomonadaceae bacterium]|nr:hypothetical protein [Pyrinomonadaceae bacterium]